MFFHTLTSLLLSIYHFPSSCLAACLICIRYPVASNKETALLGGGAFGKVYRALQVEHRLKRAIKFIDVAMAGGGAGGNVAMVEERLREEAKAAIDAVHTNVLRV